MPENKQPNPQYVINALMNQVAQLSGDKASRDAIITEQQQEINALKQKLEKQLEKAIDPKLNSVPNKSE